MATSCTEALNTAKKLLEEQNAYIKDMKATTTQIGTILTVTPDRMARISVGGTQVAALVPEALRKKAQRGSMVALHPEGGIVDVLPFVRHNGPIATVRSFEPSTGMAEVSINGETVVVFCMDNVLVEIEQGSRVQLDVSRALIVAKLPDAPSSTAPPDVERVTFDQIGGLDEAKRTIEEAVLWPMQYGKLFDAYQQRQSRGLLFYGPPGCGKTMLAKATATLLSERGDPGFFAVRGPELVDPFVGETERKIRELFATARAFQEEHGRRAVIFVDEADSILGHRGTALHCDISVPAFLVEMDGVDKQEPPLVILATNRPKDLDAAIVREGRVDRRVHIDRPSEVEVTNLFALYLAKRPVSGDRATIAGSATADMKASTLWPHRSGAQVAALVDRATNIALRRDIDSKAKKPSGITAADCKAAVTVTATAHALSY